MTVDLDIPEEIATSLHIITVQRMLQTLDPINPGETRWVANGGPGSVTVEAQTGFSVVTLHDVIRILKDGRIVKEIEYKDANGDSTSAGGSKTDQIAFSLDNRLMFIAGTLGDIHVLDTATMQLGRSFSVGTTNISSLAVSGQWLYVAEGSYHDPNGNYRLLRVNIDVTSTDFLQVQQIDLPQDVSGTNAPFGYIDMAMTNGVHSYLAVTASKQSLGLSTGRPSSDSGNVFILDLDASQVIGGRRRSRAFSEGRRAKEKGAAIQLARITNLASCPSDALPPDLHYRRTDRRTGVCCHCWGRCWTWTAWTANSS